MRKTVLYVEDEPDDVFFMVEALRRTGAKVSLQSVGDGRQALAYLAGEAPYGDRNQYPLPALVLLDLNLPLLSGFEVLQWIRQHPELQSLPVAIFSSSGYPKDREKARALVANEYLLKPSSGVEFVDVAKRLEELCHSTNGSAVPAE
jgi:CheY-like chemotaxis protein